MCHSQEALPTQDTALMLGTFTGQTATAYAVSATGEGKVVNGAEPRGTYRVVMRERPELVRGVQAGEVSGVSLQQERNSWVSQWLPTGTLSELRETRFPHTTPSPGPTIRPGSSDLCSASLAAAPNARLNVYHG